MDSEALVMTLQEDQIQEGAATVRELDAQGVSVPVALWVRFQDQPYWKLALSLPGLRNPREAYRRIQRAIQKGNLQTLTLNDVALLRPDAPLISNAAMLFRTGNGISSITSSNNSVNGQVLPDMYVYRMNPTRRTHAGLPLKSSRRTVAALQA